MGRRFGRREAAIGIGLAAAGAAGRAAYEDSKHSTEPVEQTAEMAENEGVDQRSQSDAVEVRNEGQLTAAQELVAGLQSSGEYTAQQAEAVSGVLDELVGHGVKIDRGLAVHMGNVATGEERIVIASTDRGDGVKVAMNGGEMTATFIEADTATPDTGMEGVLTNAQIDSTLKELAEMGVTERGIQEAQDQLPRMGEGQSTEISYPDKTGTQQKVTLKRTAEGVTIEA